MSERTLERSSRSRLPLSGGYWKVLGLFSLYLAAVFLGARALGQTMFASTLDRMGLPDALATLLVLVYLAILQHPTDAESLVATDLPSKSV